MGQKIIPTSLRLNKNKNWNSSWIDTKINYSNILYFDLEIRKYFEKILNTKDIKLIKINIYKSSKNIYIYLYIQKHPKKKCSQIFQLNKIIKNLNLFLNKKYNIKIFIITLTTKNLKINKNISKIFKFFKKNNKLNFNFKRILYIITFALHTRNFDMISNFIKESLKKRKRHGYIYFINNILKNFFNIYPKFLGYKIQIKGRINGSKRSRKLIFQEGKIPLNTLKYNIYYTANEFNTPSGNCSIKIWFFLKDKKCYFQKEQNIKNNLNLI